MPESGLPADVEQFIADYIRTIEHLFLRGRFIEKNRSAGPGDAA